MYIIEQTVLRDHHYIFIYKYVDCLDNILTDGLHSLLKLTSYAVVSRLFVAIAQNIKVEVSVTL